MTDGSEQRRNKACEHQPNAQKGPREGEAPAEPRTGGGHLPQRKRPASGVLLNRHGATIVYVTVCTRRRRRWLATPEVHHLLRSMWRQATAWLVGRYVIMPDHIHLFAALGDVSICRDWGRRPLAEDGSAGAAPSRGGVPQVDLDGWVTYWKSQFTRAYGRGTSLWQPRQWDTRLRRGESYASKWDYVRHNPVRHGLVANPEQWPFQGEVFGLEWRGA